MSCPRAVSQWTEGITTHMPQLSKAQATGLALGSLGMGLARSGARSAVSQFLAQGRARQPNTVRQQLREWCSEATAKRGGHRSCIGILLAVVYMAIFLELLGSTLRTRLAHTHGHLLPPTRSRLGILAIHTMDP